MLVSGRLVLALAAVAEAASLVNPVSQSSTANTKLDNVVSGAYIVELTAKCSLAGRSEVDARAHERFHKRAAAVDYPVRRQFTNPTLFYGLSIDVQGNDTDAEMQDMLRSIDGVVGV